MQATYMIVLCILSEAQTFIFFLICYSNICNMLLEANDPRT